MMELHAALHADFIRRGAILHSEMFEDIGHGKFFAVIGVSAGKVAGFFFINSRIHPVIMRRPAQLAMQYQLRRRDYSFLRYDSFLCATVIQEIPVERLAASAASGETTHVGQLTAEDLAAVLEACRASDLFSNSAKRKYFSD